MVKVLLPTLFLAMQTYSPARPSVKRSISIEVTPIE